MTSQQLKARRRKTMKDMALSLSVLLAVVLSAVGLWAVLVPPQTTPIQPVDPAPAVAEAQLAAPFTVVTPAAVPAGWTATSARYVPGEAPSAAGTVLTEPAAAELSIGYLTPEGEYVGLRQTGEPYASVAATMADSQERTRSVAGRTWTVVNTERGEEAWLLDLGDSTVVITGSAPAPDFEVVAASLS